MSSRSLLLIDDHLMMAEALAVSLESLPDIKIVGCRTWNDAGLLDTVRWLRPDVIMFEPAPYVGGAGETARLLLAAWPTARLIVLSGSDDAAQAVAAARVGADAWVSKNATAAQLESILGDVLDGGSSYPPAMLGKILRELRSDLQRAEQRVDPLRVLTARERDVLACMVAGSQDRQIGMLLNISADTARTHARNIFSKLGVKSRLEAVAVAVGAGLRPTDVAGARGVTAGRRLATAEAAVATAAASANDPASALRALEARRL